MLPFWVTTSFLSCSSGAPGSIAATGSNTAGRISYSTFSAGTPASAAASLSATTAAMRWPTKRATLSSM